MTRALFLMVSLAAAALLSAPSAFAQEYWKVVNAEQIKRMNTFERAQYTKANELLTKDQYRAAATEFEKFKVQFKDSEAIPYMLFLQAYCLHLAKDRNAAIKVYNEVVDIFGGEIKAAAPALYYRGLAQLDNGDYAKGMQTMKELVEDEDYKKEPVAAAALVKLVENHWKNKDYAKAVACLQQVVRDFNTSAPQTSESAQRQLAAYYFANDKAKEYESWYLEALKGSTSKSKTPEATLKMNMVRLAYDTIIWQSHIYLNEPEKYSKNKLPDIHKALWTLMAAQKASFDQGDAIWTFYLDGMRLLAPRKILAPADFDKFSNETMGFITKLQEKDKVKAQKCLDALIDVLIQGAQYELARYFNAKVDNKLAAAWNEYAILEKQEKWDDALKQLDSIKEAGKGDSGNATKCLWAKAGILKEKLKKYDEAIKLYQEIAQPPRTLWEIQECHYRKGDLKAALSVLNEIEAAFPDDGADASWRRTEYYDRANQDDMAIKEARAILKKYPKSPASSRAHQFLEKHGIDTGGAVAD